MTWTTGKCAATASRWDFLYCRWPPHWLCGSPPSYSMGSICFTPGDKSPQEFWNRH